MRSFHQFDCHGEILAGTLDGGHNSCGLLIVSGGNEIRAGAHAGMAKLAQKLSAEGYPVFRYDRRGIGDSSGINQGFLESSADIHAATQYFRKTCPGITKLVAFGNCDAASALTLFGKGLPVDRFILANPWVIEQTVADNQTATAPPPSAIRSRYWQRIKNPRSIIDLLTGKIDLGKLVKGLKQASQKHENTELSIRIKDGLAGLHKPCRILLANHDTTALAFLAAWNSKIFANIRKMPDITTGTIESASHGFADDTSRKWLENQILEVLKKA
ncbi:hydrolase 1, exosortase A system-associated [Parasphingorhabdus sp. JC815]|uniref:hydrolase 1, exosortase A system-associated n=1 Tax=Parasphingorhabdus sp. JC815 TaxID=3232140 RepID=UPI0034577316